MRSFFWSKSAFAALAAVIVLLSQAPPLALAASGSELTREARYALDKLYGARPVAKDLSALAKGILVFPNVIKAGLMVGGQFGEGVLFKGGEVADYYNTVGASYGLQAGAQSYGYALFFMSEDALAYLDSTEGLEVGVGPSVVVVDEGMARSLTSTTAQEDVYAFIFDQSGLMAGLGIQGNKITKIDKP